MNKAGSISAMAVVGLLTIATPHVMAQLNEFTWKTPSQVGPQSWQVDGNWDQTGWPDDPGRVETDMTVIVPSEGANVSVPLTGNLTLDVGDTNVTVASLKLGGTLGAVTTDITSVGNDGKLVFENYEATNTTPSPDACSFNCGAALVTSAGVAGSTNIISAPVHINGERLEFAAASTNDLTISGPVTFANLTGTAPASISSSSIRSFMPTGTKLTISGSVSLVDTVTGAGAQLTLMDNGTLPSPTAGPETLNNPSTGTIEISGVITDATAASGSGTLMIGTTSANQALGTLILSGANNFRGRTTLNRANLVLANDSALGVDSTIGNDRSGGAIFANGNPSNNFGFNIISDNDARAINVDASLAQWQSVKGTNSLTWSGMVTSSNSRGWVNLLPAGKTLTISGLTYASTASQSDVDQGKQTENRIFTYDGSGTTLVTGGWRNKIIVGDGNAPGGLGHFRKTGTGVLIVTDPGNANNDFTGDVLVDQGNLHFTTDAVFDQARNVESFGGAVGVDTGTFTNSTLMTKLRSMSPGLPDLNLYNGGLMLTPGEAAAGIDFTAGDLQFLSNMSVAAPENGISYTGTITPKADATTTVETYRLGGGSGTLTLPNIQLTGARDVQVTNGGEVRLEGANTYTGKTILQAKYHSSVQNQAIADTSTNISTNIYEGTTLSVTKLLDGGADSSIGKSTGDAANLVIQGSTLKYVGTGSNGTTNRLFTVGTGGATLDASGAAGSAMNFTNSSSLAMAVAANQSASIFDTGTTTDGITSSLINTRTRINIQRPDDLVIGMTVLDAGGMPALGASGLVFNGINNPSPNIQNYQLTIPAVASGTSNTGTVSFSGVARTLTLTGSNTTDNNTLNSLITNAAAATGTNTVNIVKTSAKDVNNNFVNNKWILTGNNTYSGTTTVSAGTLLINGTQSGNGVATVAAGATLGGTGTYGGAITNNGIIAPGASVGTLSVTGNVTMADNSHFAVELSGTNADKLAITGDLDLSGTGTTPFFNYLDVTGVGSGSSWLIATYTGIETGIFESITPGYSVTIGGGQVVLNTAGVPGDFNNDTKVNLADYVTWRKDPTNPNFGGANGYFTWRENFGTPASGSGLGGAAVPEPASLLLVGLVLAIGIGGVRRRY
jgi:autotransporter-associated beta strand protein